MKAKVHKAGQTNFQHIIKKEKGRSIPVTRVSSLSISSTAAAIAGVASATTAGSHLVGSLAAVLGEHHSDLSAVHLVPVQVVEGISSIATVVELNERKASGSLGVIVLQKDMRCVNYCK